MAAPYLVEIRTGGETKSRLREIIYDVANQFDVRAAAQPRAVPHITLFGPYNTNRGAEVKRKLQETLSKYRSVPYRISGFGRFEDNDVVYLKVIPSSDLRSLRRDIFADLRPLSFNYQPWDSDYFFNYHITVAFKDAAPKIDDIWNYVTRKYDPQIDEYATRVTALRRREMMWEWDIPRGKELRPKEATSRSSWEKTESALKQLKHPNDHDELSPMPWFPSRIVRGYGSMLAGGWRRRRLL